MEEYSRTLNILGSIAMGIVGFQICRKVLPWIYVNVLGPKLFGSSVNLSKMGEWAVITGSTDGIGKAYARELARKGMKLVLISRSLEKLNTVAKEIGDEFGVETRVIDVDFTGGLDIYKKIREGTTGLDVGVLVNNVGISYNHPEYFLDLYEADPKFLHNLVAANIHSVTHMTALFMPGMVTKRKGVIINLSSTSGVIPNPLLSVYSGTKAFVNKFSDDLYTEYKAYGILIQSVQPGFVATNMSKIRKPSWFAPSPETYVKSALATLGFATQTAGYLPHALLQLVIHFTEAVFGEQFARNEVLKNISATRKRARRRLEKEQ
ncbi:very-long-chain 3-oxoacyl-CoA reductase [Drosophila grimshawi]|uniref:GH24302 n=1 Tax=Drosophila grimshawi TaxID=7222 RepID=B4JML9_DROGR|nr:very-long-chain 3-oxoacyl-CoA reductase [Drosophila grimshawi]EDV91962.1 GH24302 [Drosophila grimshawi]